VSHFGLVLVRFRLDKGCWQMDLTWGKQNMVDWVDKEVVMRNSSLHIGTWVMVS
jgi:hypothetical protein